MKKPKSNILKGGTKSGHNIHPSSVKPGSGSGNLYNHVKGNVVDKQSYSR